MKKNDSVADLIPATAIAVIGIAEFSHLCGVFVNRSFYFCTLLFGALAVPAILLPAVFFLILRRKKAKTEEGKENAGEKEGGAAGILLFFFAVLVFSQICFVLAYQPVYRRGDMTVETVGSFLQNNTIYGVNPMTGQAYSQGIPSRIKILCLPTLYGALCRLLHLTPQKLVWQIAPVLTLIGCYGAYASLGFSLFGGNKKKRRAFLIAVALLVWAGNYQYGMDGFGLLRSGWRGVTIRNAVLVPWTFSLCLRKKWLSALLCVAAEACLVWSLYGMGVCLFVVIGMGIIDCIRWRAEAKRACRKEAEE